MDYRQSGVDIDAGNETVRRIKSLARGDLHARRAVRDRVVRRAVPPRRRRVREPVLVSSADGVGTKLKVAFMTGRHDTIGARPGQSLRQRHPRAGRASRCSSSTTWRPAGCRPTWPSRSSPASRAACRENGCALLGGETAEMPGFYADGEYDIAGFIVGRRGSARRSSTGVASRRATC